MLAGFQVVEADAVRRGEQKVAHGREVDDARGLASARRGMEDRKQQLRKEKVAHVIDPELKSRSHPLVSEFIRGNKCVYLRFETLRRLL